MPDYELVEDQARKLMFWESVSDKLAKNVEPSRPPGVMAGEGVGLALNFVAQELIGVPLKIRRSQFRAAAYSELGAVASHHVSGPIPEEYRTTERPHAESEFLQLPNGQGTVAAYDLAQDFLASIAEQGDGDHAPPTPEA